MLFNDPLIDSLLVVGFFGVLLWLWLERRK